MCKFRNLGFRGYNEHLKVHSSLLGVLLTDQSRTVARPEWGARAGFGVQSEAAGIGLFNSGLLFLPAKDYAALRGAVPS
jgi:hypothetical protein